jgi:hypothetical protein
MRIVFDNSHDYILKKKKLKYWVQDSIIHFEAKSKKMTQKGQRA